jgi:hypothetical protein
VGSVSAAAGAHPRRQWRDGTPIDVLLAAAPLHEAADTVSGVLYLLLDLTELEGEDHLH